MNKKQKKNRWVSNKISKLVDEGKSHDQAVAQALSMAEDIKFQEGGMQSQYSKTMYPILTKEIAYPILRVEPATQGNVEGYRQYYTDPNSHEADYSFLSKEDYMRKKQAKQGSKDYEPYLNMYLKRTGNREGINVSYEDGGEYLPQYQNGVWNNNQAYPFTPNWQNSYQQQYRYSTPGNELWSTIDTTYKGTPIGDIGFNNQQPTNFNFPTSFPSNDENAVTASQLGDAEETSTTDSSQYYQNQFRFNNFNPLNAPKVDENLNYKSQVKGFGYDTDYKNLLNMDSYDAGKEWEQNNPLPDGVFKENLDTPTDNKYKVEYSENKPNSNTQQPYQFFNPYGGVDIPTAASVLGSSIASGNTFGTVTSGLKLGTGLARNFLGGMGQQRVANRANQRMAEDTRDAITRTNRVNTLREEGWNEGTGRFYGQDGGEMSQEQGSQEEQMVMQVAEALQQGMPPEEVLQQLMQMGLDEAQATQLIQMVMQQLQGQAPQQEMKCGGKKYEEGGKYLEMLKNKRIKNYTFNSETNSYDIEFED